MTMRADEGGFDAGWLFVVAGLVVCAAGLLIPAQRDLAELQDKLALLRLQESVANERVSAHADFLSDLDGEDPALVRRLAGAHLNLMPEGDTPALLASSVNAPVTDWIDATVRVPAISAPHDTPSRLARWATGPHRLWMLASGVMCVFVGLVLDPAIGRGQRRPAPVPAGLNETDDDCSLRVTAAGPLTIAPSLEAILVDEVEDDDESHTKKLASVPNETATPSDDDSPFTHEVTASPTQTQPPTLPLRSGPFEPPRDDAAALVHHELAIDHREIDFTGEAQSESENNGADECAPWRDFEAMPIVETHSFDDANSVGQIEPQDEAWDESAAADEVVSPDADDDGELAFHHPACDA